jgi:hypothetical protein
MSLENLDELKLVIKRVIGEDKYHKQTYNNLNDFPCVIVEGFIKDINVYGVTIYSYNLLKNNDIVIYNGLELTLNEVHNATLAPEPTIYWGYLK